jgi:hypothetical protein
MDCLNSGKNPNQPVGSGVVEKKNPCELALTKVSDLLFDLLGE